MIYKRQTAITLLLIVALFATLCIAAWLVVQHKYALALLSLPVVAYVLFYFYRAQVHASREITKFAEGIRYRDFTQFYNTENAPPGLYTVWQGFNDINATFKTISKERETQFHYLQNILGLVDTGILSYDMATGEISWMNESLKRLLKLPYLKNINSLEKRFPELAQQVLTIKPGERNIATLHVEKDTLKLLLSATAFQAEDRKFKLIAFQNANEALDETEAAAWQKLLRVMTHEIMNSVAPIASLADTMSKRLEETIPQSADTSGAIDDFKVCIDTIKNRSTGLLKFADTYRNLSKIKVPEKTEIAGYVLFENLYNLMQPTLDQKNIELNIVLPDPSISLNADISLVEQALINLLLNAIDAVKDVAVPSITLKAFIAENNRPTIEISDNGHGMDEETLDKIFIPFFTTRKTGSGIGLSLCRQIMVLHKGNIQARSKVGVGTVFVLQF